MQIELNDYEVIAVRTALKQRRKALERQPSEASQMQLAAIKSAAKKLADRPPGLFDNDDD